MLPHLFPWRDPSTLAFLDLLRSEEEEGTGFLPSQSFDFSSGTAVTKQGIVPTFTRATTKTVVDWEGRPVTAIAGEVGFDGLRRVQNLFTGSAALGTQGVTTIAGQYTVSFTGTGTITFTGAFAGSLAGQGAGVRVSATFTTTAGTLTCTVSGSVTNAQAENVTGQSNQNPAEYVDSATGYGANVNAVRYFSWRNGNTVAANLVTAATGLTIPKKTGVSGNWPNGYLPETTSTNLVLQSEDFSTTWAAVGTPTRTGNNAQCGFVKLDLLGDGDAGTLDGYSQTITFTGNSQKGISLHVKQGTATSSVVRLRDTTAVADVLLAAITWSGGIPTVTMTTGTLIRARLLINGVYHVELLTTSVTAANVNSLQVYPAADAALSVALTGNINFGGVQAENIPSITGYIPTTTATVTRNQDVMSLASLGAWFNPAAGVIVVSVTIADYLQVAITNDIISFNDGTNNNRILLQYDPNRKFSGDVIVATVAQANFTGTAAFGIASAVKSAIVYAANDFAIVTQGVVESTDNSGTVPTVTKVDISNNGTRAFNGPISTIDYYPQRIPNAFVQALTT